VLDIQVDRLGSTCAGVVQKGKHREVTQAETGAKGTAQPAAP
jgi:hypothetical protein